ncbi:type I methionyl aminopeptidase [candidate division WOR-3 bacterium 4484_100]|uniref:Methionine aminopeptidase n=1 Tax=candidate division WOR-3 bacterium 4484_100 TaxID=1936077 RepID=A0A1V4QG69_UNCW3|nr:MAG: type I methionyl aminopeptidase [candidate division WOR-3 bacterium 4484_100]
MAIPIKNDEAIRKITVAGNIIYEIFKMISEMNLEGKCTIDLNNQIDTWIRERGGYPAFLNYRGFPRSCCISINDEVVHGIPSDRVIRNGDLVKIDLGVKYQGYIADAARTYPVGEISAEARNLMVITKQALKAGIAQARAGNHISDISRAIQETAESAGYSVVRELTGHGVGENLHEEPIIPNYLGPGSDPLIKPGMVLAIEPMVNMGGYEVCTAENGWTITTMDNSLSCHFEDTIAILKNGILNTTRVGEN